MFNLQLKFSQGIIKFISSSHFSQNRHFSVLLLLPVLNSAIRKRIYLLGRRRNPLFTAFSSLRWSVWWPKEGDVEEESEIRVSSQQASSHVSVRNSVPFFATYVQTCSISHLSSHGVRCEMWDGDENVTLFTSLLFRTRFCDWVNPVKNNLGWVSVSLCLLTTTPSFSYTFWDRFSINFAYLISARVYVLITKWDYVWRVRGVMSCVMSRVSGQVWCHQEIWHLRPTRQTAKNEIWRFISVSKLNF